MGPGKEGQFNGSGKKRRRGSQTASASLPTSVQAELYGMEQLKQAMGGCCVKRTPDVEVGTCQYCSE